MDRFIERGRQESGEITANGKGVSFSGNENILELGTGDSYTTLLMCLNTYKLWMY